MTSPERCAEAAASLIHTGVEIVNSDLEEALAAIEGGGHPEDGDDFCVQVPVPFGDTDAWGEKLSERLRLTAASAGYDFNSIDASIVGDGDGGVTVMLRCRCDHEGCDQEKNLVAARISASDAESLFEQARTGAGISVLGLMLGTAGIYASVLLLFNVIGFAVAVPLIAAGLAGLHIAKRLLSRLSTDIRIAISAGGADSDDN